jgi:hypothetical protein
MRLKERAENLSKLIAEEHAKNREIPSDEAWVLLEEAWRLANQVISAREVNI